jgi:hypothetical protein
MGSAGGRGTHFASAIASYLSTVPKPAMRWRAVDRSGEDKAARAVVFGLLAEMERKGETAQNAQPAPHRVQPSCLGRRVEDSGLAAEPPG